MSTDYIYPSGGGESFGFPPFSRFMHAIRQYLPQMLAIAAKHVSSVPLLP
jgi:hypothetical protein